MRTKLKIDHAHSMNNGIIFYSKRHKGYVAISTVDELGNIKTEWTTMKKYRKAKNKHIDMKNFLIFILCELPFVITFTILLCWLTNKDPMLGVRFFLIGYAFLLSIIFAINTFIERKKEKDAYKIHAAEHMVLNAYRKLKRVPLLEEIRQYSQFCNSCSKNVITRDVMAFTLMFFCTFIHDPLYRRIGMLLANIIVFILLQCGFLNFLQKYTTMVPTDKELLVAIAGINVWFENEKKEKERSKFSKFLHRLFPRIFN